MAALKHRTSCDCWLCNNYKNFKALLEFTREVLSDSNDENNWEKIEIIAKQFSSQNSDKRDTEEIDVLSTLPKIWLHKFLVALLEAREFAITKLKMNSFELSVLLLRAVSYICLDAVIDPLSNRIIFETFAYEIYFELECIPYSPTMEDIRSAASLEGMSEYMQLLVNFDLVPFLKNMGRIKEQMIWKLTDFVSYHLMDDSLPLYREKQIAEKAVESCKTLLFRINFEECYGRMYLATRAIEAAECNLIFEKNKASDYIYCIRMYFAATRDPLLTINEVRSMLYAFLYHLGKLHLFEPYYEEFRKLMPECPAQLEPRNLTDLARYQIRKYLRKCNLPLPLAVEKLDLAEPLKSFLIGDKIEMSRKSGNVLPEQVVTMSLLTEVLADELAEVLAEEPAEEPAEELAEVPAEEQVEVPAEGQVEESRS